MINMNLSPTDWAWVAGLLEGEGCFPVSKQGYPRIVLQMTDEDIVTRFANFFGYKVKFKPDPRPQAKDCWTSTVTKASILHLIASNIYPLLGSRRRASIDKWYDVWDAKGYDFERPICL